jgi:hypothetical protein
VALAGPELGLVQARLALQRGDPKRARTLVEDGLRELPGHSDLLELAIEIGATLPAHAQRIADDRGLP